MKRWRFWLGVLISGFFLFLVLRKVHWSEFWAALKTANYWWLLPGVAVYFVGVWVRAWRWHYLLRPLKSVSTRTMFPIVAIGYMGNNIYPARAGEVLRAVVLKRREGVPISASLATVIVERIFDGVVMLAFVFVNLAELSRLSRVSLEVGRWDVSVQDVALGGSVAFFGALAVFLAAAMFPRPADRFVTWGVNRFIPLRLREKTLSVSRRFLDGLESLRSPADAVMVFLTSVVIWLLETGKYWFVMHAFPGHGFPVSFFALMLMNGVVNLATTLPGAPGYIGTFDAPGIAILTAYGVEFATATGYTLVLHLALWAPITLLGAYYLWREGIKWGKGVKEIKDDEVPTSRKIEE
jgi:uncharacterized protein (TIRG00374 family)